MLTRASNILPSAFRSTTRSFSMVSNKNKNDVIKEVMDQVYGPYKGAEWTPKPYKDNKSRYLWTDAFGVCNYITLYYETKDEKYLNQANLLIKDVHDVLGKERDKSKRLGNSTDENPLLGGLRIGKADPEGTRDGDGQYFHYLTKWMIALNRYSIATNTPRYNELAIQLVKAVHDRFVLEQDSLHPHMYWKMSIDLSRPAVWSEGNLDPYDGYITYRLLQETATAQGNTKEQLSREIEVMGKMVNQKYPNYISDDPLDLGEALWIAHFYPKEEWAQHISHRSALLLERLYREGQFDGREDYNRLAFREFGTTIGVQVNQATNSKSLSWWDRVNQLHDFWYKRLYTRDRDITPVMFCTSMNPGVFWKDYPPLQQKH